MKNTDIQAELAIIDAANISELKEMFRREFGFDIQISNAETIKRRLQYRVQENTLMEYFPITEYCLNEGLPIVYNRGIGGYTTDEFLAAIEPMLLDLRPAKLFINIGTNDLRPLPDGADWFAHLAGNYRKICEIIRDKLPGTIVYMMAYYPVNSSVPLAQGNSSMLVRTNENIARANKMVEGLADEFGFYYIDANDGLKDENGNLKAEHTRDGIHFDAAAYRTVFESLKKYL